MSDEPAIRTRRPPPDFAPVTVVGVVDRTPLLRRVVVEGPVLAGWPVPDPGASVRVHVPVGESPGEHVLPVWTGNQFELPDVGGRAEIRTLTPLGVDPERRRMTLDVVLHDGGVLSDWARRARIGDRIAVSGPGRGFAVDPGAASFLFVGDETAVPAIEQLLEAVPSSAQVTAHVEIRAPDAALDLGSAVRWHVADNGAPVGDRIVDAVAGTDDLADVIWVAGEAAAVQRIRNHLFVERGLPRTAATVRGYWKHGRAESAR